MKFILFLLCFGVLHCTVSSNRLRVFSPKMGGVGYNISVKNCADNNQSLVTLYDEEDANFIGQLDKNLISFRVSLHRNRIMTWSDGTPYTYSQSNVTLKEGQQMCEAIVDNTWKGFNCTLKKSFMCYRGDNYTLIKEKRNWCQALDYCRGLNLNLVSISNDEQNQKVIEEGKNQSFWIGLLHDDWKWEDNTCSLYRNWDNHSEFTNDRKCAAYSFILTALRPSNCDQAQPYFCSKGFVRIIYVNESKTWEEAFNYCRKNHDGLLWISDQSDQSAVEQWLNYTQKTDEKIWIGLRQSRIFGFWIWTSNIMVCEGNWKNGKQPQLPLSNHCGVINNDYTWSDEDCLVQHPFLCEEKIIDM